jgi:uncharacterized protein YdeI (YjbR/CyaY-like superfamily)
VDAYIAASADFARPILAHLRAVVHAACPAAEETMKWGFPHFMHEGILCSMASFKQHCAFGFWKGALVVGDGTAAEAAMGQFGRIASLDELPPDEVIAGYVREAARLNEAGVKRPTSASPRAPRPVEVPEARARALAEAPAAEAAFGRLSPSHRREYAEWIAEAKGEATRARRAATAVEWIAEGKGRNWKYERR